VYVHEYQEAKARIGLGEQRGRGVMRRIEKKWERLGWKGEASEARD
jgi:hypothetical protein